MHNLFLAIIRSGCKMNVILKLIWEQRVVSSNLTAPTNGIHCLARWRISSEIDWCGTWCGVLACQPSNLS
jgi:hypothetical protein